MQTLVILMPSGMRSRGREFQKPEDLMKVLKAWEAQMCEWKNFEAWLLILEEGEEIAREHIEA